MLVNNLFYNDYDKSKKIEGWILCMREWPVCTRINNDEDPRGATVWNSIYCLLDTTKIPASLQVNCQNEGHFLLSHFLSGFLRWWSPDTMSVRRDRKSSTPLCSTTFLKIARLKLFWEIMGVLKVKEGRMVYRAIMTERSAMEQPESQKIILIFMVKALAWVNLVYVILS